MHNFAWLTMSAIDSSPSPAGWTYNWGAGQSGVKTQVVTNNNDFEMTLTLGAWSPATRVSWVTSSPVTIAAHGTASVRAEITVAEQNHSASATVGYSVATGPSGDVTVNAEKETGA